MLNSIAAKLFQLLMDYIGQYVVKLAQWGMSFWKNDKKIKETEAKKESLQKEIEEMKKDGLTEEEKNEIRRKKIELEEGGFNSID